MKTCHILEELDLGKFNSLSPGIFVLEKSTNFKEGESVLFINCPKNDIAIDMMGKKFRIEGVIEEAYNIYPHQVLVSLVDI